jgi:hypothetical protein
MVGMEVMVQLMPFNATYKSRPWVNQHLQDSYRAADVTLLCKGRSHEDYIALRLGELILPPCCYAHKLETT